MHRLEAFPSAASQEKREVLKAPRSQSKRRFGGRAMGYLALVAAVLVAVVLGLLAVAASGLGTGRLQIAAQDALTELAGEDVSARFGDARLTFWGPGLVGLEMRNARFETQGDDGSRASAERVQFGLLLAPLLSGDVRLSGVELSGLRVALGSGSESTAASSILRDERGLFDPDLIAAGLFSAIGGMLAKSDTIGGKVVIRDASFEMEGATAFPVISIDTAEAARGPDGLTLAATGNVGDIPFKLYGTGTIDSEDPAAIAFDMSVTMPDYRFRMPLGELEKPFIASIDASANLFLSGRKNSADEDGIIRSVLEIDDFVLETVDGVRQPGGYRLEAVLEENSGKVEIERLEADIGRTRLSLHGAIQPAPAGEYPDPVYRYELVSDGSSIAADDAPERAVGVLARIAGVLDMQRARLTADELRIRTTGGEVIGNAALVFEAGKTPAAFLAIEVPRMPVAHAKQLWPWKAADGARSWVLDNVFGGEVRDSNLEMSVVAGRFGDGILFEPDEVFGHFEVVGTRFDTAGEIPPVRDANGTIDFAGTDVTIKLSSGTAYLPSGRTVDAANGVFEIDASERPLVGALEIDVAGAADAVAELATFEPVRADRFVDLEPDDFVGTVSGHVSGQIPLQEVPDPDVLNWRVSLDYENLGVGKAFDGQILTEATGSIVIDPESAVIKATGKLNDITAEIALVEPLDGNDALRTSDIKLVLDDKDRGTIAPSLNTVLKGRVTVDIANGEGGTRSIVADLTRAQINFPWAGWKKGAGVPAMASFSMREDGELLHLSNIRLAGESFVLAGSAAMKEGEVESANFEDVRLNRGDSFDLSVKRGNGGYTMNVRGDRIDARSLIRQFLSDPKEAEEGLDDTPVALVASAREVLGFGGEVVTDVNISYSGAGTDVSGLEIAATTATGKRFAVVQEADSGGRRVAMQSADAGAILRFLNIYEHMQGGSIDLRLAARSGEPLRGQIDARDFWIVNEPRLEALVATAPEGDGRSLNQAVKRDIDVSRANFEQGFARIEKGDGYLAIADGVLRGPLIGSTFQGELYDKAGNMSVTGTFMPAYGLNRLFADIPLVGLLLGNGRDRGLIGITYRLSGDAKSPNLQINPISAIAPGVFRQIFEFR